MTARPAWLSSVWGRVLVSALAVVLGVVLFTFSLVLLAVFLSVGLVFWGWALWRTRDLRRELRARHDEILRAAGAPEDGAVIEGEYHEVSGLVRTITQRRPEGET